MKTILQLSWAGLMLWAGTSLVHSQNSPDSWTHFRGNQLHGISEASHMPLHWDDSLNVAWKYPVPGKGWSSPLVLEGQVWLTTADKESRQMRALCLDDKDGALLHDILLFQPDSLYRIHAVNSYATPTGALESGRAYLHFGRYGTACLDSQSGKVLWKRTDLQCEHIQGPGSSLLIHDDKLIVHMEGSDVQYLLALDKKSGETIWRVDRPREVYDALGYIGKKAYITPIVMEVNGRELLISNGSAACIAYDIATGEEVWRWVYGEDSTISMPVAYGGLVYFYTGFETDSHGERIALLVALDPGGKGTLGDQEVVWKRESPILQLLTPVIAEGRLYTVDSKGIMWCLDASSGEEIWSQRMKGKFHSSPVLADGKLYVSSTRGYTYVMKEGTEALQLAENKVDGEIWATPAALDGTLLLRSSKYLYKIRVGP